MESVKHELEHPRTKMFFGNVILHAQLIEFPSSENTLSAYPELEAEAAKLALSWIIDISIESKHALAKAIIASAGHNISEAYFAVALRQRKFGDFVDDGIEHWKRWHCTSTKRRI